jgi:outer membrane protein OmpA-like peptidoglycan-associated protein
MGMLGPQVSGALASQMGESSDTVKRGLDGSAAAMLSGLAAKADEPGFLNQILGILNGPQASGALSSLLANPAAALSDGGTVSSLGDLGSKFLSLLFGSRLGSVTDAIGQYSGMGAGKASSLLTMAAPLVLAGLSKFVRDNNSTSGSLASSLRDELPRLHGLLPAGFRGLLGGVPAAAAALPTQTAATTNKWLWPVVILAALLLAGLWFFNHGRAAKDTIQSAADTTSSAASSAMSALGEFFKTKLPNGVELNLPQFGVENRLLSFIQDTSKPVDETTWFNFDRLTFDTGKTTLQPASQEQLNNIAEILKAYPNVHLKIGGYTDNTGDPAANQALSTARANNVTDALVSKGIDSSRLAAEGYGEQHPVADNGTEEGRQMNRRTAMRVTQK